MSIELILAIIGIVSAPAGAGLTAIFMRRKYRVEIDSLKAEVDKKLIETRGVELTNVREGIKILMDQVVAPLKTELKSVRNELKRFREAIKQIPACPHGAGCPVSLALLAGEACDDGEPTGDK